MRRMESVAEEDPSVVPPPVVSDEGEIEPPDEVVRQQRRALQIVGEYPPKPIARLVFRQACEAGTVPRLGPAFDDEGAERRAELVRVRRKRSPLRLPEGQRQPVKKP